MVEARAKKGNFLKGKQPNFYVGYATLIKSIFSNNVIYQIGFNFIRKSTFYFMGREGFKFVGIAQVKV